MRTEFRISDFGLRIAAALCLLGVSRAEAARTAATASYADVNNAVNGVAPGPYTTAAADGDIINIPSGSFTWNETLEVGSKGISIIGAGSSTSGTVITNGKNGTNPTVRTDGPLFRWNNTGTGTKRCRLSGIRVNSSFNHEGIVWLTGPILKIRVDNCYFEKATIFFTNYIGQGATGPVYGVVDHCTFHNSGRHGAYFATDVRLGESSWGSTAWAEWNADKKIAGTDKFLYFEDNTFLYDSGVDSAPLTDATVYGSYGGRACLRYNTFDGFAYNYLDAHGDQGSPADASTLLYEIYNNTFTIGTHSDITNGSNGMHDGQRGGMQLLHDNTYVGNRLPLGLTIYFETDFTSGAGRYVKNTFFWGNTVSGFSGAPVQTYDSGQTSAGYSAAHLHQDSEWFLRAPISSDVWGAYIPLIHPHPLVTAATPPPYPKGVWGGFGASGAIPEGVVKNPGIVGITVTEDWSVIEPDTDGGNQANAVYKWATLDAKIVAAKAGGFTNHNINLGITASTNDLPDWLRTELATATPKQTILLRDPGQNHSTYCKEIETPLYWGTRFHAKRLALIAAAGLKYNSEPTINAVYASFANHNSLDWNIQDTNKDLTGCNIDSNNNLCTVPQPTGCTISVNQPLQWLNAGFTRAKMLDVGKQIADAVADAFPDHNIKLPIGGLETSLAASSPDTGYGQAYSSLAQEIEAYVMTRPYNNRFYTQRNTLDGGWGDPTALGWFSGSPPSISAENYIKYMVARRAPLSGLQDVSRAWHTYNDSPKYRQNSQVVASDAVTMQNSVAVMASKYGTNLPAPTTFGEVWPQDSQTSPYPTLDDGSTNQYYDPLFYPAIASATQTMGGTLRASAASFSIVGRQCDPAATLWQSLAKGIWYQGKYIEVYEPDCVSLAPVITWAHNALVSAKPTAPAGLIFAGH
jgi:hypothetical protein